MAVDSDVQLRILGLDDAPEAARLSGQLGYPASDAAMRARLARVLASPAHVAFGAAREGKLLGWVAGETGFSLSWEPLVEITGLVVDSAARRSGVGRLLVAAMERWALGLGHHRVTVRSNVARTESHTFYLGLGFRRDKTQHAYGKDVAE